jgi:hydrogenase maturation protease
MSADRVLVAGIGNIFLGDDGFGPEVVRRLQERPQPAGVDVFDYGIRGLDLAFTLMEPWKAAILVDALPQGAAPGTLNVIEPDVESLTGSGLIDSHGMNPVEVLNLVKKYGATPPPMVLVGCEPGTFGPEEEGQMELSQAVQAAIVPAVEMVETLVQNLLRVDAGQVVEVR